MKKFQHTVSSFQAVASARGVKRLGQVPPYGENANGKALGYTNFSSDKLLVD